MLHTTKHKIHLLFVFIALIVVAPMLLDRAGGDIIFQMVLIECFAGQFWQGDLFPKWCMAANGGLGSPLLLYYFPLPLYIASIFYPLTFAGLDLYYVYVFCCFLATLLTAYTGFFWLKRIAPERIAFFGMVFLLFMPYRMETLYYRSAYAELWCLAFAPLLFHYAWEIANHKQKVISFALVCTAMLLSHVPAALITISFAGFYIALYSKFVVKPLFLAGIGVAGSIALSAFQLVPALLLRPYVTAENVLSGDKNWSVNFLQITTVTGQTYVIFALAITLLVSLVFFGKLQFQRKTLPGLLRREANILGILALLGLFLMLPISKPIYDLTAPLSNFYFPWRMQSIIMFASVVFITLAMQVDLNRTGKKTHSMDYVVLFGLFLLMSQFLFRGVSPEGEKLMAEQRALRATNLTEYRTTWVNKDHYTPEFIKVMGAQKALFQVVAGRGIVEMKPDGGRGFVLKVEAQNHMVLRLKHYYFPIWQAHSEQGELKLTPEKSTGMMLLKIPAGNHDIKITRSVIKAMTERLKRPDSQP